MLRPWLLRARPLGVLVIPHAPLVVSATPSSGQITLLVLAVEQLVGGSPIAWNPVITYRYRIGLTDASVEVGGTPMQAPTDNGSTSNTFTGLAAGTYWVSCSAINNYGESDASTPVQVTVP